MPMQQNISLFILTQKEKRLLMRVVLMIYLNQYILQLYQPYKSILKNIWAGSLIQQSVTLLISQSTIPQLVAVISSYQRNQTIQVKFLFKLKMPMIMNALNSVWSDTYIPQIIIQKELETLANYIQTNSMLKI